jgi:hypothetical protein
MNEAIHTRQTATCFFGGAFAAALAALPAASAWAATGLAATSTPIIVAESQEAGTTGTQLSSPKVAHDEQGNFAVAYRAMDQLGKHSIVAALYAADGTALGEPFTVASGNGLLQGLAMDADGNFVVVYEGPAGDNPYGLFAQRYAAGGSAQGSAVELYDGSINGGYGLRGVSVSMNKSGAFALSWCGDDANNGNTAYRHSYCWAQAFSSSGDATSPRIQLGKATTLFSTLPPIEIGTEMQASSITLSDRGTMIATWKQAFSFHSLITYSVFAHRYSSTGTSLGFRMTVAKSSDICSFPSATSDSTGNFAISYCDAGSFRAQRYTAAGRPISTPVTILGPLAMGPSGDAVAYGATDTGMEMQYYDGSLNPVGPTIAINGDTLSSSATTTDVDAAFGGDAQAATWSRFEVAPGGEVNTQILVQAFAVQ